MKTTAEAIDFVYSKLSAASGITNVYKLTKPSNSKKDEFIVINSLPVNADVLQRCVVNVNCHVADITEGTPDLIKLKNVTSQVVSLFEALKENPTFVYFDGQEFFREPELKMHYSNIRLSVKLLN